MKMISAGREITSRDYRNEKDGEKIYKTETKFPELTISGKKELGQLPYGKEVVVKIKLKATGYGERNRYNCCSDEDEKVPEATFEVLEIEIPAGALPVKINEVKQVVPGSKMDEEEEAPETEDED